MKPVSRFRVLACDPILLAIRIRPPAAATKIELALQTAAAKPAAPQQPKIASSPPESASSSSTCGTPTIA